jgi:hypothetical protein
MARSAVGHDRAIGIDALQGLVNAMSKLGEVGGV